MGGVVSSGAADSPPADSSVVVVDDREKPQEKAERITITLQFTDPMLHAMETLDWRVRLQATGRELKQKYIVSPLGVKEAGRVGLGLGLFFTFCSDWMEQT